MPYYLFIYEHQFISELDVIEPDPYKQMHVQIRVERACARQITKEMLGYGFARVCWTRDLLAWYQTNGTTVYLLSIKYDLLAMPRAA